MKYYSPLRYPGGKAKIINFMKEFIKLNYDKPPVYVEPYVGGASVALSLLIDGYAKKIYINDNDFGIYSFWKSILEYTEDFIDCIKKTPITMDSWNIQKNIYNNMDNYSLTEIGFATFFLNRCNYSGIIKGGPIGGKKQLGTWKIDARFNKVELIERISKIAKYKNYIKLYNEDTLLLLKRHNRYFEQCLLYLDPPYFNKGYQLYNNHYKKDDHAKIANIVKKLKGQWIVSYDNAPEIVDLYSFVENPIEFSISYSAGKNKNGKEIMFVSKQSLIPSCNVC